MPIIESEQFWPKTDRKDQDSNTAPPRDKKMPQFVKEYDQTKDEQKRNQVAEDVKPKCM
jgi:hypothetical protein